MSVRITPVTYVAQCVMCDTHTYINDEYIYHLAPFNPLERLTMARYSSGLFCFDRSTPIPYISLTLSVINKQTQLNHKTGIITVV